ncbi:hypothetical protein [Mammaliicoccus vitulinus]|uniref:hypothetical protein n=1 Tax=Mammaliicoccus vitulinus TaxID=71237 RepID=UPI00248BA0D7|nr:hypothetical protein [Mammaliicoccus vitulinus]
MYKQISIDKYIPKKHQHKVDEFFKDSDGCWLNLKEGYISAHTEATSLHEDTINEVRKQLNTIILECDFEVMTRSEISKFLKEN